MKRVTRSRGPAGVSKARKPDQASLPPPTEKRNPRSMNLDKMPISAAIRLMLSEEASVPGKLLAELPRIARVVNAIARALRQGGRLFYVGAGTSGRLGVLDASECPPTFSTAPSQVQGIIAGGVAALTSSVEGAEDDAEAGRVAVMRRGVCRRDVVGGGSANATPPLLRAPPPPPPPPATPSPPATFPTPS